MLTSQCVNFTVEKKWTHPILAALWFELSFSLILLLIFTNVSSIYACECMHVCIKHALYNWAKWLKIKVDSNGYWSSFNLNPCPQKSGPLEKIKTVS